MGEAARKQKEERETFTAGLVNVPEAQKTGGTLLWLEENGFVFAVMRGRRLHDPTIVEAAHEAARAAGRSSSKIIRPSGIVTPK